MHLTETEKKILLLAMDRSAPDGEVTAAAGRLIRLFRKRYRDGYELIGDLESLPKRPKLWLDAKERHAAWLRRRATFGQVTLRFGKHRGKPLAQIPADYLIWVLQNCLRLNPCTREAIEGFLQP
jgi:hypothetical protein